MGLAVGLVAGLQPLANIPSDVSSSAQPRVLYSFPHRIGAGRICTTAWHQVASSSASVSIEANVASVQRPLPSAVAVRETLARGRFKLPYRLVGDMRMYRLHDRLVARRLKKTPRQFDVVHCWPGGALETLRVARELGITSVLERPNAHTRYAYTVVARECERLGVALPPDQEHAFNDEMLALEEEEYALADLILCPADFVRDTFLAEGFPEHKLVRHGYGYDPAVFHPPAGARPGSARFTMLFVGVAAVRKGLHFALEAWLASPASEHGTFVVAGEILPAYEEVIAPMLRHPSIEVLGHSSRVPELMREADVFVLPSLEEGSALVCAEALASGAVPIVSAASSGHCRHMENALVHEPGDVATLTAHITRLYEDPALRSELRDRGLESRDDMTWERAGERLSSIYRDAAERTVPQAA